MRIALMILLAASAAPAIAAPGPQRGDSARDARAERQQRAERRAERREARDEARSAVRALRGAPDADRPVPALRPSVERVRRDIEPDAPARVADVPTGRRMDRPGRRPEGNPVAEVPAPGPRQVEAPEPRRRAGDTVADWRLRDRGSGRTPELVQEREGSTPDNLRDWRQRRLERIARGGQPSGRDSPVVSRVPREGTQPPPPEARRGDRVASHWRGDWRRDRRYDWWNWRRRNRARFHLGFYFDPFGWSYRRYSIGWRLWPVYYGRSYWLSDPWSYRLPYAPPGYRWIRYYDDALLVDTWDGRVVDVIHNFFW